MLCFVTLKVQIIPDPDGGAYSALLVVGVSCHALAFISPCPPPPPPLLNPGSAPAYHSSAGGGGGGGGGGCNCNSPPPPPPLPPAWIRHCMEYEWTFWQKLVDPMAISYTDYRTANSCGLDSLAESYIVHHSLQLLYHRTCSLRLYSELHTIWQTATCRVYVVHQIKSNSHSLVMFI